MQIIWDREVVKKLQSTHTVLELETFDVKGFMTTVYCVVPAEKIGLGGFATLEAYTELHKQFIQAYNEENYPLCRDLARNLMGAFGGECDSFYEEILARINSK